MFQFYAPKAYEHCRSNVKSLLDHHPELERPFTNSVYTTFTANMGPSSATTNHVDPHNGAQTFCAVTSAGPYNYKKGGHLVLYDLGLIVEFPPGWTAILPSATIRHGNTRIQKGEKRYSITQYISGNLFQWVRHKFRLAKDVPEVERAALDGDSEQRLRDAYGLFSKVGDLAKDRELFA